MFSSTIPGAHDLREYNTSFDINARIESLKKAAQLGHPVGMRLFAIHIEKSHPKKAFELMHKAAIQNDPDSMYHLARMQLDGYAPEFTTAYAKYWLVKSASLGFYKAFTAISGLYQNGKSGDIDVCLKTAFIWHYLAYKTFYDPNYERGNASDTSKACLKSIAMNMSDREVANAKDIGNAALELLMNFHYRWQEKILSAGTTAFLKQDFEAARGIAARLKNIGSPEAVLLICKLNADGDENEWHEKTECNAPPFARHFFEKFKVVPFIVFRQPSSGCFQRICRQETHIQ